MSVFKILCLGYRHVGDTLFLTPAFSCLKRQFPQADIHVILGGASAEILRGNPHVDKLFVLEHNSFREKWRMRRSLMLENYDAAFLFQHTFLNAVFLFLLRIPLRAGLDWKGCGAFLTHKRDYSPGWHEVKRYLMIADLLIQKNDLDYSLNLFLSRDDTAFAEGIFRENAVPPDKPVVVLNPGSSWKWRIKRWPPERFARLSDLLQEKRGATVIFMGGGGDDGVEEVRSSLRYPVINLSGKTTLKQLGAVLQKADLLITNDTGPMHVGCAVGIPVIDIVGSSNIEKTGPTGFQSMVIRKDLTCSPCTRLYCDHVSCLRLIAVEEVYEKAVELLRGSTRRREEIEQARI